MQESQAALREQIRGQWERYREMMPKISEAYDALPAEAYADGALSGKTKRLMAMTAAVVSGCRACILFQADEALKLGATGKEMLECIAVATSLGGTMAAGQSTRLIGFLEERGVL